MDWRSETILTFIRVPKGWKEFAWKASVLVLSAFSTLAGLAVTKSPSILFGKPIDEQPLFQRIASNKDTRNSVYNLMEEFYYENKVNGLMLVAWEELESFIGVWVRPAEKFPGKSAEHGLTSDLRSLIGPFTFGECSSVPSLAMPNRTMVACPINNSFAVWGYVAAVVEKEKAESTKLLLSYLAHRITTLVY